MPTSINSTLLETEGNVLSKRFHVTKAEHITCLQGAIESFLGSHKEVSRETLAETVCGMSLANFSKVSNGVQGDVLAFIDKLPADIRDDYEDRVKKLKERRDPIVDACEQLVQQVFRVMTLVSGRELAAKARPAKASLPTATRKSQVA